MERVLFSEAETFAEFYRHHERAVLQYVQRDVRSPALPSEIVAETFALALLDAPSFDPSQHRPAAWLFTIADRVLLRRARTGAVDDRARRALRIEVILGDRALRRIDTMHAHGELVLPNLERSLIAAASRREAASRRRRRLSIWVRVLAAAMSAAILIGGALLPGQGRARASSTRWLPYAAAGVEGTFPDTWFLTGRSAPLITSYNAAPDLCRALKTMGPSDALIYVGKRRCPGMPAASTNGAIVVMGPRSDAATRSLAHEIVRRMHRLRGF